MNIDFFMYPIYYESKATYLGTAMHKPQISRYKKKIVEFYKKYSITRLSLFGSILTPDFKATSDVDFLVSFDKKHIPSIFDLDY